MQAAPGTPGKSFIDTYTSTYTYKYQNGMSSEITLIFLFFEQEGIMLSWFPLTLCHVIQI